jgi:hypothetical protein
MMHIVYFVSIFQYNFKCIWLYSIAELIISTFEISSYKCFNGSHSVFDSHIIVTCYSHLHSMMLQRTDLTNSRAPSFDSVLDTAA